MNVEIISIGDELLIGSTINTNASWMGQQLSSIGFSIQRVSTISDQRQAIIASVTKAMKENSVVLITGGLGPTNDDITKHVLCELFETELVFNQDAYRNIEMFVRARNGEMNENNKGQAMLPQNALFIPNTCGTASGMWFHKNDCHVISMPGVPFEMTAMMHDFIIPKLIESFTLPAIVHRHILVTGISEAKLAEVIADWENNLPTQIKLAYLPSPGIVKLRLTCTVNNKELANTLITEEENKLHTIIGEYIFGYDSDTLETLVGKLLAKHNKSLATAESCTGGNISRTIVSVPGSSAYFKGSIVAYDNSIKTNILQIPEEILIKHGAVSKEVVELMATNCKKIFNTNYAIATSGIAGPSGGTVEKPVGTVWICVATPTNVLCNKFNFGEQRDRIITRSTIAALHMLQKNI